MVEISSHGSQTLRFGLPSRRTFPSKRIISWHSGVDHGMMDTIEPFSRQETSGRPHLPGECEWCGYEYVTCKVWMSDTDVSSQETYRGSRQTGKSRGLTTA